MITKRTVVGEYRNLDGTPRQGYLEFTPTTTILKRGSAIIPLGTEIAWLDENGRFSIDLAITDDSNWLPNGWVWAVEEKIKNGAVWYLSVPDDVVPLDITYIYIPNTPPPTVVIPGPSGIPGPAGLDGVGFARVKVTADVTNNNATANTLANVTGLSFAVVAGTVYYFRAVLFYTSAATTTGARFSVSGPAATSLAYHVRTTNGAAAENISYNSAYGNPTGAGTTSQLTGNMAIVEGFVVPSANGTLQIQFASEVSSSAIIVKAGSFMEYGTP